MASSLDADLQCDTVTRRGPKAKKPGGKATGALSVVAIGERVTVTCRTTSFRQYNVCGQPHGYSGWNKR